MINYAWISKLLRDVAFTWGVRELWQWQMFLLVSGRHCRISYVGGLGTSRCIMGLTTQDPYIQKEHTELYKILKFRVNWANIEQDTAIQKLQNLQIRTSVRKMYGFPDKCPAIHTFVTKFWSFWMAVSRSILAQLTRNFRVSKTLSLLSLILSLRWGSTWIGVKFEV